jgi:hypothetical protein
MIGEWLLLVLLVPAVVVPLVLLGGFAGCSILYDPDNLPDPQPPDPPTITSAEGTSVTAVRLEWSHPNPGPFTFRIERTAEGQPASPPVDVPASPFEDMGLSEGTTYFYRVAAIRTADAASSAFSAPASASTFGLAFTATLSADQAGLDNFCLLQRIEPSRLLRSGGRVSITVRGSTAGPLRLNRVFISQPAVTGDPAVSGDPYDAHTDLTEVASVVDVPPNTPVTLPTIDYALDQTRPLLVAFDVGSPGNVRHLNPVPATEARMFFRPSTAEAAIRDRQPPTTNPGAQPFALSPSIYLVERIHVGS